MVQGGELQMLEWLVSGGGGGGYGRILKWVWDGKETAVAQVVEVKGRGAGLRVREVAERSPSGASGSSISSMHASTASKSGKTFESIRAWLEHVASADGGDDVGALGRRQGDASGQDVSRGKGGEEVGLWEKVFLGERSLRECAQRRASAWQAVGAEQVGVDGSFSARDKNVLVEGFSDGEGLGGEERARLARQVRVNELAVLEGMCGWIESARSASECGMIA